MCNPDGVPSSQSPPREFKYDGSHTALLRELRYGGHQTSIDTAPAGLKIRAGIERSWKSLQFGANEGHS